MSFFLGALRGHQERPFSGGVFRIKPFADAFRKQLDPAHPESDIFVSEQLYDGLVRLDKGLNVTPSLADYWVISPDGKTYTFYLKKGIRYHTGEEVTAWDVKFSLERLGKNSGFSPPAFLSRLEGAKAYLDGAAEDISGIRVIGPHTLEIRWTRPYVSALYLLSTPPCKILPRKRLMDQGEGFFQRPSGTGPFRFDRWIRDTRLNVVGVRLERNENYFGGKPFVRILEFCPLYTLDHFLNGEIDAIPVLTERLLDGRFQVFQDGSLQKMFLGMSCRIPPLDDPRVRRAIQTGIDRTALVESVEEPRFLRIPTGRFIPSKLPGFLSADEPAPPDPLAARRLLEKAGFSGENRFPRLTLFLDLPRTEFKHKISRELRRQLDDMGIAVRVRYYRSLDEVKSVENPCLVLVHRMMLIPDPEDMVRPLFFSKSPLNVFGYANPEVDRLLEAGAVEKSWSERIRIYRRIEMILQEEVPAVPLYSEQNRVAMQPRVRGVEVPPLGLYYLEAKKIWLRR